MNLADLQYLTASADAGNFARAAKAHGLHPSTISRRIGRLEDELGLTLFERGSFGIRLTGGGRSVMVHVRRALADLDAVHTAGRRRLVDKILRGCKAGRYPGRTANQIRSRHQSEDGQSAQPCGFTDHPRPRRRSNRMKRRDFRVWRKADDDRRKRGLVTRLFAIDTYPALFDHAISKQRKIRNDFSARVTWRLLCWGSN
jgi:hypothetical protein